MSLLRSLSLAIVFLLVPWAGTAHSAERAWFRVELIVFERTSPSAGAGEYWPADPGSPDRQNAAGLQPAGAGGAAPAPFERLPGSAHELGPHRWSLGRGNSGTEPLLHLAWIQPVRGDRNAVPVYLSESGRGYGPRLEGTVRVRISRFLHADLDLLLRRADGSYRMRASRRMRSGELHYIDHPVLGVLMKISRVKLSDGSGEGDTAEETGAENPPPEV